MNRYILQLIEDSHWLDYGAIDFMQISNDTPKHLAIERIWLNVSLSFNTRWQMIEYASPNDTKLFAGKIVVMVLIHNILRDIYELNDNDISSFLGINNISIIEDYFEYIKIKNS
jgi:hypothetical protein